MTIEESIKSLKLQNITDAVYDKMVNDVADKVYARIKDGEDDEYSNFAKNLRTAIEVAFREAIVANPDVFRMRYD